jgi:Zn-dependent protease
MRDPLTWSLRLASLFGITIRVHLLFPLIALGLILRIAFKEGLPPGIWIDATWLMVLLFVSVLLHEFGHCLGARLVDGDAHEILLWPLGGLASIDVPQTARANFLATAAGPAVNVLLCLAAGFVLAVYSFWPPFSPWWDPYGAELHNWAGDAVWANARYHPGKALATWQLVLAQFFWVNWILFLINTLLIGFPLDGGRMFQCLLWPHLGYRQATFVAVVAGFITTLVVCIYAIAINDVLPLMLGIFIYFTCRQQWIFLETGGEESLLGYDFSQGYTSLERDQPPPPRRQSWFQRWMQRRAARKMQREQEEREAEERRMDELLEKVQRLGLPALTDEERRFLTRVSAKYRNRQ